MTSDLFNIIKGIQRDVKDIKDRLEAVEECNDTIAEVLCNIIEENDILEEFDDECECDGDCENCEFKEDEDTEFSGSFELDNDLHISLSGYISMLDRITALEKENKELKEKIK